MLSVLFNITGTTANATQFSSAAANTEGGGDNKTTDEDDSGKERIIS